MNIFNEVKHTMRYLFLSDPWRILSACTLESHLAISRLMLISLTDGDPNGSMGGRLADGILLCQ
jgi:hypothetical protein